MRPAPSVHLLRRLERVDEGREPAAAVDFMNRRKIATKLMDLILRDWQRELQSSGAQAISKNYVTMTFVYFRNYSNGMDPWAGRFLGRAVLSDMADIAIEDRRASVIREIMEVNYSAAKEQELLRNLRKLGDFVDGTRGRAGETFLFDEDPQLTEVLPHKNTWLTRKHCLENDPEDVEILQFSGASVAALERRLALAVQVACAMQANQGLHNEHCAKAFVLVQDGGLHLGVQSFVCIRKSTITDAVHGFFSVEWAQAQKEKQAVRDTGNDTAADMVPRRPVRRFFGKATDIFRRLFGRDSDPAGVTAGVFKAGRDTPHFKSELSIEHIRRAMLMKQSNAAQSPKVNFGRFLLYQQFVYHLLVSRWKLEVYGELDSHEQIFAQKREIIEALTALAFEDRDFRNRLLPRYDISRFRNRRYLFRARFSVNLLVRQKCSVSLLVRRSDRSCGGSSVRLAVVLSVRPWFFLFCLVVVLVLCDE